MPLSASLLAERLWNGTTEIDQGRTLCVVPLVDIANVKKKNAAALDLRLGRWFRTMRQTKVIAIQVGDSRSEEGISKEHYIRFDDNFVLHPGEFVIGITLEWLKFPFDLSGYVTGKSSWGRRGLIIETAAGIHPGFTGCLTLELANVGAAPIKLNPGMQIVKYLYTKSKAAVVPALLNSLAVASPTWVKSLPTRLSVHYHKNIYGVFSRAVA